MSAEEWRPVPDFPDYLVSDQGRVASLKKWQGQDGPRLLRSYAASFGYPCVHLYGAGGARNRTARSIHSLVAEAFIGPRPPGQEVRHLDGDPKNCRLDNLAYGTKEENEQDKFRHGTNPNSAKTECIYGHPYDERNTRTYGKHRFCIECDRRRSREYRARLAERQGRTFIPRARAA